MRDSVAAQAALLNELITSASEPTLREAGISAAAFELLSAVRVGGGRATQAEIAERLGITPPSLSEAVRSAVNKGFVEQVAVEGDARLRTLRLTEAGRKVVQKVVRAVAQVEREMLADVSPEDQAVALDVLRRASRNLARHLRA